MSRGTRALVALLGLLFGAALPVGSACTPCPELEPAPVYRVVDERPDWVPDSGRVEVDEDRILIRYSTLDGSSWELEYEQVPGP